MGKYNEALGTWKHELIGNNGKVVEMELTPQMGDNNRVAQILTSQAKHKDSSRTLKETQELYIEWVKREETLSEEDEKGLRTLVELNQAKLLEDISIAFRWSSKEDIDKLKEQGIDQLKN